MYHKLIELYQHTPVRINLALLGWSLIMLWAGATSASVVSAIGRPAFALVAALSVTSLATSLFQWIQGRRPSTRFKALQPSIVECLRVVESNVDLDLPEDREQDIDRTHVAVIERHGLFNELASLGIALPDASSAKDVVKFLLHIALYSQGGTLEEARKFSEDLKAGKVFFE